jgi:tetratricopeptide (TPR) repeat protein
VADPRRRDDPRSRPARPGHSDRQRPTPAGRAGATGGAGRGSGRRADAGDEPRPRPRALGPVAPEGADPRLLDHTVRKELSQLAPPVAERVATHLVAVAMLLDGDPARAYEHAKAAKDGAPRLGSVREAVGLAAYAAGDFAAALAELRAARRITGDPGHLPVMADCERGLGRPERALALAKDPDAARLDRAARVELAIVVSGARRDLGQPDAAVVALQGRELDDTTVHEWTPRLWYAYAEALEAAGRTTEAREWFQAVAAEDDEGATDADARVARLSEPGESAG